MVTENSLGYILLITVILVFLQVEPISLIKASYLETVLFVEKYSYGVCPSEYTLISEPDLY